MPNRLLISKRNFPADIHVSGVTKAGGITIKRLANESVPTGNFQNRENKEYSGYAELRTIEENMPCYNAGIVRSMAGYMRGATLVLEFGAGIGTLAMEWAKQTGRKPECLEIDAKQQRIIAGRGFVCYRSLAEINKQFDGIYSSNVFEHIENDVEAFQALHSILADSGTLVVFVPAFMCLFSALDHSLGHYRRYHKNELLDKAKRAGFQVIDCYYADSIGFLAWFLALRLRKKDGPKLASPASLRFYDAWVYPVSRLLDRLFLRRLLGKNLLLIAKKQPVHAP